MKILVVDDNIDIIKSINQVFSDYEIISANNIENAKNILDNESNTIDIAIIDVRLGDDDGLELLKYIKENYNYIECIMISGFSNIEKAVNSIKLGAFDFIEKPLSYQKLKIIINNAYEHKKYNSLIQKQIEKYKIIGHSSVVKKLYELINKASQNDMPVLIIGESGSGKEHIANLIHYKSKRAKYDILKLNCAAIPENLFESELFGYEKGAFTGANKNKKGLLESAYNGTVFLDEIGEMPLILQSKLLRVLEEKEIIRLGGDRKIKIDFRLICATNRDLKEEIKKGNFREDFYYRIGVLIIEVPPLRDRKEDIPDLIYYFLSEISNEYNVPCKKINDDVIEYISKLPLKGNIRELKNIVQRLFVYSEGDIITINDIKSLNNFNKNEKEQDDIFSKTMPYNEAKKILERMYILKQLEIHSYNISKTAASLNLLPNNLSRKIKELDIKL